MKPTTVWQHLAPADHETFVSSAICWLMDPKGDHGLSDKLLRRLLCKLGVIPKARSQLTIRAEVSEGRDKRFDISVYESCKPIARFEVKCKTVGNIDQLKKYDKYDKKGVKLGRIAFAEWNYEGLGEEDREKYPLITFRYLVEEICQILEQTSPQTRGLVESFAKHLQKEHVSFEKLRGYLIEGTEDAPPPPPTMLRFSQRFYNQLYWHWFQEKWRKENLPPSKWESKSEHSGVWLAGGGKSSVRELSLPALKLHLPYPLGYWVHIELRDRTGILADENSKVGSIQLRIRNDNRNRADIYCKLRNVSTHGFNPPARRPSSRWNYWTALKRPLKLKDCRFSELCKLICLLTPQE